MNTQHIEYMDTDRLETFILFQHESTELERILASRLAEVADDAEVSEALIESTNKELEELESNSEKELSEAEARAIEAENCLESILNVIKDENNKNQLSDILEIIQDMEIFR